MKNSLVSVIILNWNQKKYTPEYLKSVFESTHKLIEGIVVDNDPFDNSSINTKQSFSFAIFTQNNNFFGFAKGNNLGFYRLVCEHVFLQNNNTVVNHNIIEI